MLKSTSNKDLRTLGLILKRTNYAEADRILNILTPQGKISAIAKGARREKSKLAGGIEMFTLVDLNLHIGRSEFAIVTGAKTIKHYNNIIKDYTRMEFAASILKKINSVSESSDNPDYFDILNQTLSAININININLIETWFIFNIAKASGEDINLYRDKNGQKLESTKKYNWDPYEKSLVENSAGEISSDEIKIMRLILTNKLTTIAKIKSIDDKIPPILFIAKSL